VLLKPGPLGITKRNMIYDRRWCLFRRNTYKSAKKKQNIYSDHISKTKLNKTEMLVDYRKFEKSIVKRAFCRPYGNEWESESDIFPKEKSNLPPKNSKNLNYFLIGLKNQLTGRPSTKPDPI
jgi:hypothetical protein